MHPAPWKLLNSSWLNIVLLDALFVSTDASSHETFPGVIVNAGFVEEGWAMDACSGTKTKIAEHIMSMAPDT